MKTNENREHLFVLRTHWQVTAAMDGKPSDQARISWKSLLGILLAHLSYLKIEEPNNLFDFLLVALEIFQDILAKIDRSPALCTVTC